MRSLSLTLLGLLGSSFTITHAASSPFDDANVKDMFDTSMEYLQHNYDSHLHYMYSMQEEAALRHSTVESPWYALGLLMRNDNGDADEAEEIISAVIDGQFTDKTKQWYGTYTRSPSQPEVGSSVYPAKIWGTYDPNYREFVGTTLAIMLEEHSDILSDEIQDRMEKSLEHAVIGGSYRVGGVDGDNLYPGYSNPAIMRAFTSGYLGRRIDDKNMTKAGEDYANEILELFNKTETLSEFGSTTYFGISLFGLNLWAKYLPDDSVMKQNAPNMIRKTWDSIAERWNPYMKNMAGPWDRTYGFDMNRYFSLLGLWLWAHVGKDKSSLIPDATPMTHGRDHAWAPIIATLKDDQEKILDDGFFDKFTQWSGTHTVKAQVYYPPYDTEVRNVTTWMSKDLTIGAQSYRQTSTHGPTTTDYTPAAVQWLTGEDVDDNTTAFMILRPSEKDLDVDVSANSLKLSYPSGSGESEFTISVGTFLSKPDIGSITELPGLNVTVKGNVNPEPELTFGGRHGGSSGTVATFEVWNFKFTMPGVFVGVPTLELDLETTSSS